MTGTSAFVVVRISNSVIPLNVEVASSFRLRSRRGRFKFVDCKLRGRFDKRCARRQVVRKLTVIIQPPLRSRVKNQMRRAAAPQLFHVGNDLRDIERVAIVNSVSKKIQAAPVPTTKTSQKTSPRHDPQSHR